MPEMNEYQKERLGAPLYPSKVALVKPVRRGFLAPCIKCGAEDVTLRLGSVQDFHCDGCGEDFAIEHVREHLRQWGLVLGWLAAAPALPE
jgi:uncharacterized protein (DUF983 family)